MKRSKAPLPLMELLVMVLVFALASALCLQAFVKADALSRQGEAKGQAFTLSQSAAEAVRACRGDLSAVAELLEADAWDDLTLTVNYDKDWKSVHSKNGVISIGEGGMTYALGVYITESGITGLGTAGVWVRDEVNDVELARLEFAWQEVDGHD